MGFNMYFKDFHGYILDEAIYDLDLTIKLCKKQKDKICGLIVGYGSSNKSHKIKTAFLDILEEKKNKKIIKDFICGEDLDIFSSKYLNFKYRDLIPESEKKIKNKGIIYLVL